jgi:hypothetical protein
MARYLSLIGRSELLDFPDFLLTSVPAKTDTGAYRSAVHAENIVVKTKNGKQVLCFELLANHPSYTYTRHIETEHFVEVEVENSFGVAQKRFAIELKIRLAGKIFKSQFTLADRSKKPYPILMGRKMLNKRYLVDSAKSNINRNDLKKKMNIDLVEDLEVIEP